MNKGWKNNMKNFVIKLWMAMALVLMSSSILKAEVTLTNAEMSSLLALEQELIGLNYPTYAQGERVDVGKLTDEQLRYSTNKLVGLHLYQQYSDEFQNKKDYLSRIRAENDVQEIKHQCQCC